MYSMLEHKCVSVLSCVLFVCFVLFFCLCVVGLVGSVLFGCCVENLL